MASPSKDFGIIFSHKHDSDKDELFLGFRNGYLTSEYHRFKECLRQIQAKLSNVSSYDTITFVSLCFPLY